MFDCLTEGRTTLYVFGHVPGHLSMVKDCFDHADWDMFQVASENNMDIYADSVSEFIRKCIGDVVPTVTIKTYPNQKQKTESANNRI